LPQRHACLCGCVHRTSKASRHGAGVSVVVGVGVQQEQSVQLWSLLVPVECYAGWRMAGAARNFIKGAFSYVYTALRTGCDVKLTSYAF